MKLASCEHAPHDRTTATIEAFSFDHINAPHAQTDFACR
jgi:hypothetical protein